MPTDTDAFVRVWNSGTPEYTKGIKDIVDQLPFTACLSRMVEKVESSVSSPSSPGGKRGNLQENYGFCSAGYVPRDTDNILKNYGTAVPSLLEGTREFAPTMMLLSSLAEQVQFRFTDKDFLKANKAADSHMQLLSREIQPGVKFGLVSVIAQRLDGRMKTKEHEDTQNADYPFNEVMTVSRILTDKFGRYVKPASSLFLLF